jgi:hypothetical protein
VSLIIRQLNGSEGQVELAGNRAVVAMFYKWSCERRGESDEWTLRASLSFQKYLDSAWKKVVRIKYATKPDIWYRGELGEFRVVNDQLITEVIKLWREEQKS